MGDGGRSSEPGQKDEQALLARSVGGDAAAFADLLAPHRRLLDAACATAVSDPTDREDALQLAMVDIWRGLAGFKGESLLTTWMFRVAQNAARRHARRGLRVVPTDPGAETAEIAAPSADWSDALVTRSALVDALRALPEDQRDALLLHTQAGMSMQEIADLKFAAVGTVKAWVHRARAELARSIEAAER